MALRTTFEAVQGVLLADYGKLPDNTLPELVPFMQTANNLTTQVYNYARQYRSVTLDTTTLELIERWLTAHFYCCSDQPLASKSTGKASTTFQGKTGEGICGTKYGRAAISTDYTRTLAAMDEGRIAIATWGGKVPSDQIPYTERN